jgi:murein DD-endopeptidase MepM/ murein hydrolase activator NlpD
LGETGRADYNYGYGAMIVLEYRYEDLSLSERQDLSTRGVTLQPGQSLYLTVAHLNPGAPILAGGTESAPGDVLATIGTSGNSEGPHAHVEAVVAESSLSPAEGTSIATFWTRSVAQGAHAGDQGRRVDPSELFGVSGSDE